MLKYDIIQIVLKFCGSKVYFIVLIPNIKRMYDQIDQIEK